MSCYRTTRSEAVWPTIGWGNVPNGMDRYENRPWDGSCIPTAHFRRLLDDTGIFQHCNGAVPNWRHGYCVDDVARAMIVMCGLDKLGDRSWTTPLTRCA